MNTTTTNAARVLEALGTGLRPEWELSRDTGLSARAVRNAVRGLVAAGTLARCAYGVVAASAVAS
jgi:DNA-binding IclR family transcriptional regulator